MMHLCIMLYTYWTPLVHDGDDHNGWFWCLLVRLSVSSFLHSSFVLWSLRISLLANFRIIFWKVKIWFQNRRTKWKKQEHISNAKAAEYKIGGERHQNSLSTTFCQPIRGTQQSSLTHCWLSLVPPKVHRSRRSTFSDDKLYRTMFLRTPSIIIFTRTV